MFKFIKIYSAQLMFFAAVLGFFLPAYSNMLFKVLPLVLFLLMFVTLIGIDQNKLWRSLISQQVWVYAFVHSFLLSVCVCSLAFILGADENLLLAISAVTATGSLFATPAIVRSLGCDPLEAMSMTIASTLIMPVVLYINLTIFYPGEFVLDMHSYLIRLVIFIGGPMVLTFFVFRFFDAGFARAMHVKLSSVSMLLVFTFPFGLIGSFSGVVSVSPHHGLFLFLCAIGLMALFFCFGLLIFLPRGKSLAFVSAITLGNRNLLLTYAIASPYLGVEYLPLIGALQLPMFSLPWLTKNLLRSSWVNNKLFTKNKT